MVDDVEFPPDLVLSTGLEYILVNTKTNKSNMGDRWLQLLKARPNNYKNNKNQRQIFVFKSAKFFSSIYTFSSITFYLEKK